MNRPSSSSLPSTQHQGPSKSFYDFPAFSPPLIESSHVDSILTLCQHTSGDDSIISSKYDIPTTDRYNGTNSTTSSYNEEINGTTTLIEKKLSTSTAAKASKSEVQDQYHLYEDIWMDSPIFEEFLDTLENWLAKYLTWLENAQQCRQLEIAYNKAVSLLHNQTKSLLNQPFYTLQECEQFHWPNKDKNDGCDNEEIDTILSVMVKHGKKIETTFNHNKSVLSASRTKLVQLSNMYCAVQKSKASQNYLDEIASSLHRAKKNLSKRSTGYIQKLFSLIQSTRDLLNQELILFFKNLKNSESKNLRTVEELIENANKFMSAVDTNSYIIDQEGDSKQLSRYISQKSASYYRFLNAVYSQQYVTSELYDFPFSNTSKITSAYNIFESLFVQQLDVIYQMGIRGYLLMKQKSPKTSANNHIGKWDRHFLYISKLDGLLKQYKNQNTSVTLLDLKNADILSLDSEKRSCVIQVSTVKDDVCILLQSETYKDHSRWLHSLSVWNSKKPHQEKIEAKSKSSSINGSRFLTKRSVLSEKTRVIESLSVISRTSFTSIKSLDRAFSSMESVFSTDCDTEFAEEFKIYKSCYSNTDCDSLHSGGLWIVEVNLDKNRNLRIQTKSINGEPDKCIRILSVETSSAYCIVDSSHYFESCIAIRSSPKEVYHFVLNDKLLRDIWLKRFKIYCLQPLNPKKIRCLTVRLTESKKIQTRDPLLYCDVLVDQEIRGWTGLLKKTSTISWGKDFIFSDTLPIDNGVAINMYSKSSKSDRGSLYGSVFIPVEQILLSSSWKESWYEIKKEASKHRMFASFAGLGSGCVHLGDIRIGLLWEEHDVLALSAYYPLINALKLFDHEPIYDIVRRTSNLQSLAKNLLSIYESLNLSIPWIKSLIDFEVASLTSDDANILFRGNSFFTKVVDCYMKMNGGIFLEKALKHDIERICIKSLILETDSWSSSPFEESRENNSKLELLRDVDKLWNNIQNAKGDFPNSFREMFEHLKSAVVRKFSSDRKVFERQHEVAKYTCVSGFVFLRWICPAIISPKQFGLVQDYPDINTSRILTLLAKCLMALVNHSALDHNNKDSWSNQSKDFIKSNTDNFIEFMDYISVTQENKLTAKKARQECTSTTHFIDLSYELAQFTQRCLEKHHIENVITRICHSIDQNAKSKSNE
ncbi:hypothetical protein BY458DRAFT_558776 [Sporodiniella umbellata]|nr:hypothetical protein BY458DRAFT_558776 [Sporodiniella umbellata]